MSSVQRIQLKISNILKVPLQRYEKDFCFVVNGEKFSTSRIISDLLSPKICDIHYNDPTADTFIINTVHRGNFSNILQLVEFKGIEISNDEIPFISEVMNILGNDDIESENEGEENAIEMTVDNIIKLIETHSKYPTFYSKILTAEIDFASSHFNEILINKQDEIKSIEIEILKKIIDNNKLVLTSEDQLLKFINELYINESKYSSLYESIYFENVTTETMEELIKLFDMNDLTNSTWNRLTQRLLSKIKQNTPTPKKRYVTVEKMFLKLSDQDFVGIFNHLRSISNNNIENEIIFDSLNCKHSAKNVVIYDDKDKYFNSSNVTGNWISLHNQINTL